VKLELTDSVVRSLKPNPAKKYTVWDTTADPTGLGIRVRPTGVKTYVVRARPRPTDRQIMVTLGRAGTLKLASARKAAWDALQQMQRGLNPNHEKRKLVVESFGALAEMYMAEELPQKRQGHQVARYIRADWLGQIPHRRPGRDFALSGRRSGRMAKTPSSATDLLFSSHGKTSWLA
jgi:Arm domain-containing DNA-binding protein